MFYNILLAFANKFLRVLQLDQEDRRVANVRVGTTSESEEFESGFQGGGKARSLSFQAHTLRSRG